MLSCIARGEEIEVLKGSYLGDLYYKELLLMEPACTLDPVKILRDVGAWGVLDSA